MSENPLNPSAEQEGRIRERAYHLWEQEGRPSGRDAEFWQRAREFEAIAGNSDASLKPNPLRQNHGEIAPTQPIEEAEIMENLGEFPARITDQGETLTAPATKRKARSRNR